MDYTSSDAHVVDAGTGHRMHQDTAPITTAVSARDLNQLIWSLMKVLADGAVSAATFDPANVNTYNRISLAIKALAAGTFSFGGAAQYAVLPSGLIVQMGVYSSNLVVTTGVNTPTVVTLPLSFPNACYGVQLTPRNPGNDEAADSWPELVSQGLGSFSMVPQNLFNAGSTNTLHGFNWLAYGR